MNTVSDGQFDRTISQNTRITKNCLIIYTKITVITAVTELTGSNSGISCQNGTQCCMQCAVHGKTLHNQLIKQSTIHYQVEQQLPTAYTSACTALASSKYVWCSLTTQWPHANVHVQYISFTGGYTGSYYSSMSDTHRELSGNGHVSASIDLEGCYTWVEDKVEW